ncbi:TadE/TadG family type IV pilus assembly protein [Sphingomonas sp. RS6]
MIRRLLAADVRGATAIEFALLAPVFLMLLFGIIEVGRMVWVKQVLTETAYSSARCAVLASRCKSTTDVQSFATARAGRLGLRLRTNSISYTASTTCAGNSGTARVQISYPFSSPLSGFLPMLPSQLRAEGCFPKLS